MNVLQPQRSIDFAEAIRLAAARQTPRQQNFDDRTGEDATRYRDVIYVIGLSEFFYECDGVQVVGFSHTLPKWN